MNYDQIKKIASMMVIKGKGLLAADESTPTCSKRFDSIGVESTDISRNKYRDLLFTTHGMEDFISGVILYDETLRQCTIQQGNLFPEYLNSINVIPGIKVDMGAKELALHSSEKVTEGLDGLRERLEEYYNLGARFAKWRAVITIGNDIPTRACISANAHALARYAALCQEASMVPIVEPEVLMDGDHNIERCQEISEITFKKVFEELDGQNICLGGIVLKPNMIVSGIDCKEQAGIDEVADRTVDCLKKTVPDDVPGCAFLSGGQSNENATAHLNRMNAKYGSSIPWNLTFSYGRALQSAALNTWRGHDKNIKLAQDKFFHRAKCNSLATVGKYVDSLEETVV